MQTLRRMLIFNILLFTSCPLNLLLQLPFYPPSLSPLLKFSHFSMRPANHHPPKLQETVQHNFSIFTYFLSIHFIVHVQCLVVIAMICVILGRNPHSLSFTSFQFPLKCLTYLCRRKMSRNTEIVLLLIQMMRCLLRFIHSSTKLSLTMRVE